MIHFHLENKVALVTGATTGIGLAIAQILKEAGATVIAHGREEAIIKPLAKAYGFLPVWADLNSSKEREGLVKQIQEKTHVLDILVNNAGVEAHESIQDYQFTEFQKIQEVNLLTPLELVTQLLPYLKSSGNASVINVTSIHEVVPVKNNSYYTMSKAALAMFTKTAALEFGKEGIRFNNLAPGAIETQMNQELIATLPFEDWIPMGRVGSVEEVSNAALFLASSMSSYITGTTLVVDGGYSENLLRY